MNKKGFVFLETIIILVLVTMALTTMLTSYTVITTKSHEKEYHDRISDKYLLYTLSNLGTTETNNYRALADELKLDGPTNCSTYLSGAGDETQKEFKYKDCLSEKMGILKVDIETKDCSAFCAQPQTFQKNAKTMFCKIFGNHSGSTNINTSSFDNVLTSDGGNCTHVFEELRLYRIYFVSDINHALKQEVATEFFKGDNGAIEYIKTLKKCYEDVYAEYKHETTGNPCTPGSEGCQRIVLNKLPDDGICTKPVKYMIGVFERNHDYYYASIEI